ncbi:MAG TPA: prephenate dehydratase [Candidatus Syntrophoarchaeum butanivorans]|uniref:prephenate dehydratase n=2 Tax=Candidatus Syntropharchaeum butanivorans TaxID=1839936 RepID=A0A1F2P622_9EURY|nr:MAG: chorismate mutase [Candidatus Syntrophoarchaeum butanivorans]HEC56341.1 prephenate dehydratase [Candidatus Syntrophoarchaeum butanivorans]
MTIGALGPDGTFTGVAASRWKKDVEIRYYPEIQDVVDALLQGEITEAVIPIENSLEGSVGVTLDLLRECDLTIVGEVLVLVRFNLLVREKTNPGNIRMIVSHPHALGQCRRFLREHFKGVETRTVGSTAHAAKLAEEFDGVAALASAISGIKYNLKPLFEDVQDHRSVTRFVVLAKGREVRTSPTGNDKTSILVELHDKPGALYELLGIFAARGINLTRIESRPSKRAIGDYIFYIDFEGHVQDEIVRDALDEVRNNVADLVIFGSYPASKGEEKLE